MALLPQTFIDTLVVYIIVREFVARLVKQWKGVTLHVRQGGWHKGNKELEINITVVEMTQLQQNIYFMDSNLSLALLLLLLLVLIK